jgi:hypothetical protein
LGIMRIVALALLLPLVAACQSPAPEQAPGQPTAVVITDLRPGTSLEEVLQHLDQELVRAIAGDMEGVAVDHFRRAEAISDRLLEARQPFEWITSDQYSVQARLRQIQSGADRISAQLQTGVPRDSMLLDLRALRQDVLRLRQAISRGGGRAPIPLQQLLSDTLPSPTPRPAPTTPTTPAAPAVPAVRRPDTLLVTTTRQ